ncbi:putative phage tail protein [Novosphingobium sp. Rr 2-17]|uniref:gp53-like domain-containing protein n=1 Tax=Novosphingobium sp. Rr 2-17 TaxID=555793 RepID=UPI000269859D|nr:hypothetical protein [Novosphingobium sp. Rr 2-17]EIZ77769.1 putative phage tail protein [Novosphingobium sp. Rr 2-17]
MASLALKLTDAGLASVQGASGSDAVVIAELGLTASPFEYAPTLTGLPGEFKRLAVTSGIAASPTVTHLTVYDTSADAWSANGLGLFLSDGTLFAVYSDAAPFLNKSGLAFALLAFDISFEADLAGNIAYGDATFAYPPATEQMRGIAEIATQQEVDDGADDARFVTPKKLWQRLQSIIQSVTDEVAARVNAVTLLWAGIANEAAARSSGDDALSGRIDIEAATRSAADVALGGRIDAEIQVRKGADDGLQGQVDTLRGRTVTGDGLVSGGGDLSDNRKLKVTEADPEDITAGTSGDKVVTPRRLGPIAMLLEQNGFIRFFGFQLAWGRFTATGNASTAVSFVQPFPTACFAVSGGGSTGGSDAQDNWPQIETASISRTGFTAQSAADGNVACSYIAVGR